RPRLASSGSRGQARVEVFPTHQRTTTLPSKLKYCSNDYGSHRGKEPYYDPLHYCVRIGNILVACNCNSSSGIAAEYNVIRMNVRYFWGTIRSSRVINDPSVERPCEFDHPFDRPIVRRVSLQTSIDQEQLSGSISGSVEDNRVFRHSRPGHSKPNVFSGRNQE